MIVAGICERAGASLYNSAVVVGPDGYIGTYRKVHLWGAENLFFEPGDLGVPVWKTAFGRMAVAICYDGWFPETYQLAALQGAFDCRLTKPGRGVGGALVVLPFRR